MHAQITDSTTCLVRVSEETSEAFINDVKSALNIDAIKVGIVYINNVEFHDYYVTTENITYKQYTDSLLINAGWSKQ